MEYGCIGEKLPHSFSKEIHAQFAPYRYELKELACEELDAFLKEKAFRGINVTIPYKERVLPYLDEISPEARRIGSVNTIVNEGGRLCGYNTDFSGMRAMLRHGGVSLRGKKVLILGTGGTGKTARALAQAENARQILWVSSSGKNGAIPYEEAATVHADAEVILNATPVGMYPKVENAPIDLAPFRYLTGIADVVYNPLRTQWMLDAAAAGIPHVGGLYMLVAQAVYAGEIFLKRPIPAEEIDRIYSRIEKEKENVVLIGMPSCGKTTVGKALSEALGRPFYDVDEQIEIAAGAHPSEILRRQGEKAFRTLEKEVVRRLALSGGAVIACGGGSVLLPENVSALARNGKLVFLQRSPEKLLVTKDRPLSDSFEKLQKLYEERLPVYRAAADETVNADGSLEETVRKVLALFA